MKARNRQHYCADWTQTNDEGDGAGPYEDKSRVESDVGQFAEVVERILL